MNASILITLVSIAVLVAVVIAQKTALVLTETGDSTHRIVDFAYDQLAAEMARRGGWTLTRTDDSRGFFNSDSLATYNVVVFFFTSGDGRQGPLKQGEKAAFRDFIRAGGGFVGIHSAADTYQTSWPWYTKLVGAAVVDHSAVSQATLRVEANSITSLLPDPWVLRDEW
jgi:type 1 glutamine amidotransferase